jgi:predicted metalloendopeptidase
VPGVKLKGKLTSGENIADLGGLKLGLIALEAWQKAHPEERRTVRGLSGTLSDEQVYFIAHAQIWCEKATPEILELRARSDPHSTNKWRVNGPVSDLAAFAQAFQCKAGSPMSPAKVCSIW